MLFEGLDHVREDLVNLLDENNFVPAQLEDFGQLAILPYILSAQSYEIVLYGASSRGYAVLCWLKDKGFEPLCMADEDINKHGSKFFGVEVVHIRALAEKMRGKKVYAFICTDAWKNHEDRFRIQSGLRLAGCDKVSYFPIRVSTAGYWSMYYKNHKNDLIGLYDELCDAESRITLYEYIKSIIYDKAYSGEHHPTEKKYFDAGVFNWDDEECVVDAGALNGDTIFTLLRTERNFKKIYAIEAEWKSLLEAKDNVMMLPMDKQDKIELYQSILGDDPENSIDEILKGREVSLIKMDIDGAEMAALRGGKKTIAEQMPVLAICAYHKREDLIDIPPFIKSISKEYRLFLRKYYPAMMNTSYPWEMILYAVPVERIAIVN